MTSASALALALGLSLAAGSARAAIDDLRCRNGAFPAENPGFALGRVAGAGPLRLSGDAAGCPDAGPSCATSETLPAGAAVIVGRSHAGFVCVLRPDRQGGAAGWALAGRIAQRSPDPRPPPGAWRGWWRDGPDVLLIDPKPRGVLMVSGRAVWQGLATQHFGQINALAKAQGSRLMARDEGDDVADSDFACQATLDLLGPYLVVADNNRCGGMNVSFTGVYSRFTPKAKRRPPR